MIDSIVHHILATWGYYAVFAFTALEGFGLFFIPGETMLITASIAAAGVFAQGAAHLEIAWVLVCAVCGGILGDNFAFLVGQKLGFPFLNHYGHYVKINLKRLKFVQYVYLRYGRRIVFVGRFVMLFRSWESFLAGANAMPWTQFAPTNAAATLVWACVWGLGAYGLGQASERVLWPATIAIGVVIGILIIAGWIYFRRHEDELEAIADKALPGPLRARRPGSRGAVAAKTIGATTKAD
jgi:membrane protein DedA with SNARE-associated domain